MATSASPGNAGVDERRFERRSCMATTTYQGKAITKETSVSAHSLRNDPAYQAYTLLRIAFTVAPIAFGLDKFFNVMVDWEKYLAPWINRLMPGTGHSFMLFVGVVEITAGVLVAITPRYGAFLVAAWLAGIVVNLLTYSGYYDIALRDFGLLLGALTLGRLAMKYDSAPLRLRR
jgi:uncharacterized membrane protein YphA (DoxX/SURF4 family)